MESFGELLDGLWNRPWLLLMLFAAPLVLLAVRRRTYPNPPFVLLFLAPCLLSFAVLRWPQATLYVAVLDGVLFAVAAYDLFSLPRAAALAVTREVGKIASLAIPHPVTLTLSNLSARPLRLWMRDDRLPEFSVSQDEFAFRLAERSRATVTYDLSSRRRGAFRLERIYVRVRSRLGLWQRFFSYPVESPLHVYPDLRQMSEYAILARKNRLSLMGVRRTRRVGQDNEFERLRDYTPDDNYKFIDWRATARRSRLTVKDFQTNQSQRLIFMLDCGRMMTNVNAGLSLLDHALNSMLMLSYVALRQGDAVGLICFSDAVHTYVPPRGGGAQMNRLLHASFDRFPQLVESRYDLAFLHLAAQCQKRSLVILITNLIDEVNANQLQRYLTNLVGRHLPIGVLLRDHRLFDAVDPPDLEGHRLFRAAAAADILTWRHQTLTDLVHQGVLALDVFPEQMSAPLVNRYLDIKARHLL